MSTTYFADKSIIHIDDMNIQVQHYCPKKTLAKRCKWFVFCLSEIAILSAIETTPFSFQASRKTTSQAKKSTDSSNKSMPRTAYNSYNYLCTIAVINNMGGNEN